MNKGKSCSFDRNLHVRLLLLKSVSSVVKLVVGAAISVRKVSSLVPSHLFSPTLQSHEAASTYLPVLSFHPFHLGEPAESEVNREELKLRNWYFGIDFRCLIASALSFTYPASSWRRSDKIRNHLVLHSEFWASWICCSRRLSRSFQIYHQPAGYLQSGERENRKKF